MKEHCREVVHVVVDSVVTAAGLTAMLRLQNFFSAGISSAQDVEDSDSRQGASPDRGLLSTAAPSGYWPQAPAISGRLPELGGAAEPHSAATFGPAAGALRSR